jgi:hypothetical protein
MPMNNQDRDWVVEKIQEAAKAHFAPRAWRIIRDFGPPVALVAIFLTLIGLLIAEWHRADKNIEARAQFEQKTTDRLEEIDKKLAKLNSGQSVFQADLVARHLENVPALELKAYAKELTSVKSTLATSNSETPGYWSSSFQVISLLSRASATGTPPVEQSKESQFRNVSASVGAIAPIDGQRVLLGEDIEGMTFENCIVRFDPDVTLKNVLFINCIFIFPLKQSPSGPLRDIGRTLLASDIERVKISTS